MRIRSISTAGISKAVCVTAVLVFLAGWTVPAQAEELAKIYVKNKTNRSHHFCTHDSNETNFTAGNEIQDVTIGRNNCHDMSCGAACWVMKCGKRSNRRAIS